MTSIYNYTDVPAPFLAQAFNARLAEEGCSPLAVLTEIGDEARRLATQHADVDRTLPPGTKF